MMNPAVAIGLVVTGGFLVALPVVSDLISMAYMTRIVETRGFVNYDLPGKMSELYKFGCYILGFASIGTAIYFSIHKARNSVSEPEQV